MKIITEVLKALLAPIALAFCGRFGREELDGVGLALTVSINLTFTFIQLKIYPIWVQLRYKVHKTYIYNKTATAVQLLVCLSFVV